MARISQASREGCRDLLIRAAADWLGLVRCVGDAHSSHSPRCITSKVAHYKAETRSVPVLISRPGRTRKTTSADYGQRHRNVPSERSVQIFGGAGLLASHSGACG